MLKHNGNKTRKAYQEYYGEIPKGCDIHHKDRDFTNDSPDNLIALSRSAHCKEHRFDENSLLMRIRKGKRRSYKTILKRLEIMLHQLNNNIYW
ncbi:MAG: HNH endonuclease [bacterium]|nr:HNH endonuclease [bacterium]